MVQPFESKGRMGGYMACSYALIFLFFIFTACQTYKVSKNLIGLNQ